MPASSSSFFHWRARARRATFVSFAVFAAAPLAASAACVNLAAIDSPYTQNFDSLASAGTSSTLPDGWSFIETGTSADTTYSAGDGSINAGNTYSFGTVGNSDRAFGTLQSGSNISTIGACFTNNTGAAITSMDIAYTGEEWRLGTVSRTDTLAFEYSTTATALTTGTFTHVTALDFITPDTAVLNAHNGNAVGERTALSNTLTGLNIAAGATFWIHWLDVNASGADDGLAVDDFSLTPHGQGNGSQVPTGVGSANPSTVLAGNATVLTVAVTPGANPTSTGIAVSADLSAIGGSATQAFTDNGGNSFSFNATVAANTGAGSKTLPVTITDAQSRSGATSIALTVTAPVQTTKIYTIQGHGTSSPLVGQSVTTAGIVTALKTNGFFLQDPTGDGDISTSDAIFVFTSSAPTVHLQDGVQVTGTISEFDGSTELTAPSVTPLTTGNALPDPIVLDTWMADDPTTGPCATAPNSTIATPPTATDGFQAANFACLDGMRVAITSAVVTGATSGGTAPDGTKADGTHSGSVAGAYVTVNGHARPFRGPGAVYPGVVGHPELPVWSGEPEMVDVYFPGLAGFDASGYALNAGSTFGVTGILQAFKFAATDPAPFYEIYPSQIDDLVRVDADDNVKAVTDPSVGTLTVGSQNMLHFFNDVNDSGSIDACNTPAHPQGSVDTCETTPQFDIRKAKLSRMVRDVLKTPAVVGVQEVENLATLSALAARINTDLATDRSSFTYTAYLDEGNDIGGIDVGFLVRSDVTVNAVTQIGKSTLTTGDACSTSCALLNDRPPLLLDATFNGQHFAVLNIHNRSLNDIDTAGSDGTRVRAKRLQQAQYVGEIIQTWQTNGTAALSDGDHVPNPDMNAPLIIVGDYNAYEFSDSYVDVVGQIKGVVDPSVNLLSATPHTTPTFCDAGLTSPAANRYSFMFDGYVQELDHALLSRVAWKDFVRVENAHADADNAESGAWVTDPTTPARSADHDGQVVTLAIDRVFADGVDGDTCH